MNDLITYLSQLTGLQPATLILLGGVIITVANALSRLIPDDSTGFLGALRLVCKFVGVNVSNRLSGGITVNDVGRALLKTGESKPEVNAILRETGALPGPGVAGITRAANGKFQKSSSPFIVTVFVFLLVCMAVGLSGCATFNDAKIKKTLCENQFASRAALNLKIAEDGKIKDEAIRQAALSLDESLMAALNACPPIGTPAPVGR